ncbi:MAG: SDR family oxidoreductase [Deltaproteobacteria bacterium]|nr:MAG: SDR family oxidoreductase [Deltaproteobacteria bacterium]
MRRTALVTGAAKRVGRAIALELAGHGYDLAIHYRSSPDAAEDAAEACRALGAAAFTVQADLAEVDACEHVVREVRERWSRLDVLVNNASVFQPVPFEQISVAQFDQMHAVHVRAPFLLSQGLLEPLRASDRPLVLHMCDIGADRPVPGYAHYSASKAALVMLVKAMAVELGPELRVLGISPGQVAWPPDYSDEKRERLRKKIPLQRVGEPEDVARLARFLADDAPYLSGCIIPVDGGLSARYP